MLAHDIADRINATGESDLTDSEIAQVREMRYNRHGKAYAMSDKSDLWVSSITGRATGLGDGKKLILFPRVTVEQMDHHLAALRLAKAPREDIVEAYLDLRFARAHKQYSDSRLAGAYACSGIPRGRP